MPIGVFVNAGCVLVGGVIGGLVGTKVPERIKKAMTLAFGVAAAALGITLLMKYHSIPVAVLAFVIGTIIGEFINIEKWIGALCGTVQKKLSKGGSINEEHMTRFLAVLALFCFSGTGIFGAMNEGITGDSTVMITKGILDFFTSIIFASTLGYMVAFIALPQCAIFTGLFFAAQFIIPLTTPEMVGDFSAVGGITAIAIGLRIAEIKNFHVLNMLPSFVVIFPLSALWSVIFE